MRHWSELYSPEDVHYPSNIYAYIGKVETIIAESLL